MDIPNQNSKPEPLHFGHFALIAIAVVGVFGLTVFKKGTAFFYPKSEIKKNLYTYEQATLDAQKELGINVSVNQIASSSQDEKELALIDPNFSSGGSVLGESTEAEEAIANNVFEIPEEILNGIPILYTAPNTKEAAQKYFSDFSEAEYQNDLPVVLEGLSSDDPEKIGQVPEKIDKLMKAFLDLDVPPDLYKFHRLKLLYYSELRQMAMAVLSAEGAQTPESVSEQTISVVQALSEEQKKIDSQFGF